MADRIAQRPERCHACDLFERYGTWPEDVDGPVACTCEEVVHACPIGDSGVTPCCGRTPFELNRRSRMTLDPVLVTCPVPEPDGEEGRG